MVPTTASSSTQKGQLCYGGGNRGPPRSISLLVLVAYRCLVEDAQLLQPLLR